MNFWDRLAIAAAVAWGFPATPARAAQPLHVSRLDQFAVIVSGSVSELYLVDPRGGVLHARSPGVPEERSIPRALVFPTSQGPGMDVEVERPRDGRWYVVVCVSAEGPCGVSLSRTYSLDAGCEAGLWVDANSTRVFSVRWSWSDDPKVDCRLEATPAKPQEERRLLTKLRH